MPALSLLLLGCRSEHIIAQQVTVPSTDSGSTSAATGARVTGDDTTTDAGPGTDTDASDSGDVMVCRAPEAYAPCDGLDGEYPFRAMNVACPPETVGYSEVFSEEFQSWEYNAWKSPRAFGNNNWSAREGDRLLVMTTGVLAMPDAAGLLVVPAGQPQLGPGANVNPDDTSLPSPIVTANGSAGGQGGDPGRDCDGVGDCADSLAEAWLSGGPANDLMWARFEIDVPEGVHGWEADLAWFSAEFPQRADEPAADMFVWWQSSEAFTGNVATLDGAPLSAFGLRDFIAEHGQWGTAPALIGTGFEGTTGAACDLGWTSFSDCPVGGATGWLKLRGPATPGERTTHVFALFDLRDLEQDTVVLLDRWRWDCEGCVAQDTCGANP